MRCGCDWLGAIAAGVLIAGAAPAHAGTNASATVSVTGSLLLGHGWGCVLVDAGGSWARQCWTAGDASVRADERPVAPAAWPVSWLPARGIEAGANRICGVIAEKIHCWAPPARGDAGPRDLPVANAVLAAPEASAAVGGAHSIFDDSTIYEGFVGAGFACAVKANDLWCGGDDRFGQLGRGSAPHAHPPLLGFRPLNDLAAGAWHVCATSDDTRGRSVLRCWGRDDAGQLGFAATETCAAGDRSVACSRTPRPAPFDLRLLYGLTYAPNRPRGKLHAGDLFTCAWQPHGVVCWGASRDGFFGTPARCPADLRSAWPTLDGGTIAAPHAACSATPALVAGSDDARFRVDRGVKVDGRSVEPPMLTQEFDAGPRGLCLVTKLGDVWCRGAIASPGALGAKATDIAVSRGDDAAACAILDDGRLVCWGQGYSPPGQPARAVNVALTSFPPIARAPNPNPAPIDSPAPPDGLPWGQMCLINRGCPVVASALAPCRPEVVASAKPIADVAASFERLAGQAVSVRGPLALGYGRQLLPFCRELDPKTGKPLPVHGCCRNVRSFTAAVGANPALVDLDGYSCSGDESRMCCNVAIKGQTVVASGTLQRNPSYRGWQLGGEVKLCVVAR